DERVPITRVSHDDTVDKHVGGALDFDEVGLQVLGSNRFPVPVDDASAQDLRILHLIQTDHPVRTTFDVHAAAAGVEVTGGIGAIKNGSSGEIESHVALEP